MEFHGIEWDNQTWLAAKNLIDVYHWENHLWVTFQQAMFDDTGGYLASKISHYAKVKHTCIIYIISLNLVQCGHIYTYSDVCPHLSILYSIFSVLPYTMTIYIYIFFGLVTVMGMVRFSFTFCFGQSLLLVGAYIYLFLYYILYYVPYTICIYIYMVGGFKHFFIFHFIYGMVSFPLTNSIIFQAG
jgi:hypothetical protein